MVVGKNKLVLMVVVVVRVECRFDCRQTQVVIVSFLICYHHHSIVHFRKVPHQCWWWYFVVVRSIVQMVSHCRVQDYLYYLEWLERRSSAWFAVVVVAVFSTFSSPAHCHCCRWYLALHSLKNNSASKCIVLIQNLHIVQIYVYRVDTNEHFITYHDRIVVHSFDYE